MTTNPLNDPKIKNKLEICQQDFAKLWKEMMERRDASTLNNEDKTIVSKLAISGGDYALVKRMLKKKILHKLRLGNDKYFTTFMNKDDGIIAYDPEYKEGRMVLSTEDVDVVSMSDTDKAMSPKMLLLAELRKSEWNDDTKTLSACAMWDVIKDKENMPGKACLLYCLMRICRELWGVQLGLKFGKKCVPEVLLAVPKGMADNDMKLCAKIVEDLQKCLLSE